jgi:hypothetical protein
MKDHRFVAALRWSLEAEPGIRATGSMYILMTRL